MSTVMEFLDSLGPETRIAILGFVVGALMNATKRWRPLSSRWVPLVSIAAGFVVTFLYHAASSLNLPDALSYALEAVAVGSVPVAGHKTLKPLWARLLGDGSADKWLGQADNQRPDERPPLRAVEGGMAVFLLIGGLVMGCTSKPPPECPQDEKRAETFEGAYGEARLALRKCCLKHEPILWSLSQTDIGEGVVAKTGRIEDVLVVAFSRAAVLEIREAYGYDALVGIAAHELGHAIDMTEGRRPTEESAHAWAGCGLRRAGYEVDTYARLLTDRALMGDKMATMAKAGWEACGQDVIPGSHPLDEASE